MNLKIKILNWDKYFKPRRTIKSTSWFRVDNAIMFEEKFDEFAATDFWLFICLLAIGSKKMSGEFEIGASYLKKHSRLSYDELASGFLALLEAETISIDEEIISELQHASSARAAFEQHACRQHNITEHNITNITNERIRKIDEKSDSETASQTTPEVVVTDQSELKLARKDTSTRDFIATYVLEYRARFESVPPVGGKYAGVAKRIVSAVGRDRAIELMKFYLAQRHSHYQRRGFDLVTMEQELAVLGKAFDNRATVQENSVKTKNQLMSEHNADQFARIERGEL